MSRNQHIYGILTHLVLLGGASFYGGCAMPHEGLQEDLGGLDVVHHDPNRGLGRGQGSDLKDTESARPEASRISSGERARSLSVPAILWPDAPAFPLFSTRPDGRMSALSGGRLALPSRDPMDILRHFLAVARVDPNDQKPAVLALDSDRIDPYGNRHLRYQQLADGLPVLDARLVLHVRGDILSGAASSLKAVSPVASGPRISPQTLLRSLKPQGIDVYFPASGLPEFVWVSDSGHTDRVWKAAGVRHQEGISVPLELLISVRDGKVVRQRNTLQTLLDVPNCPSAGDLDCTVQTTGVGDDGETYPLSLYRGMGMPLPPLLDGYKHLISEAEYPDLFGDGGEDDLYFADLSQASDLGGIYIIHSQGYLYNTDTILLYDENDYLTHGPGPQFDDQRAYGSSVSALASLKTTLNYFRQVHGRMGVDNKASGPLSIVSRVDLSGVNAAWISDFNYLIFGSWLGKSMSISLDIAAHELTHGVIYSSSNLGSYGESGALNESLADIFGVLTQAWFTGEIGWWVGEDVPRFPPFRNMEHPEWYDQPGHMSEYLVTEDDNGGIHSNMAIPSKAFQLATDGTAPGETYYGYEVSPCESNPLTSASLLGQVAYHVLEYGLTPESTFADWAVAILGAVDDIGLSEDLARNAFYALRDAFLATGILTTELGLPSVVVGGSVTDDATLLAIPRADVVLSCCGTSWNGVTDEAGSYRFVLDPLSAVPAQLQVTALGYYPETASLTLVPLNQATLQQVNSDLRLRPRPVPIFGLAVPAEPIQVSASGKTNVSLTLSNDGDPESELGFSLMPSVRFASTQIPFLWNDLSSQVTPVPLTGDQSHSAELPMTSSFPFYFKDFSSLFISTDGYITFTRDDSSSYLEQSIPSDTAPRDLIAPYWADLDFGNDNRAYFECNAADGTTTVQFDQVEDFLEEYTYTFQVVLQPDGKIRYYYLEANGTPQSWARVGLQDGSGQEGLELAVNKPDAPTVLPYSGYALELTPSVPPLPGLISLDTTSGVVRGGSSLTVPIVLSGAGIRSGNYSLEIRIDTNDPRNPLMYAPLQLEIYD